MAAYNMRQKVIIENVKPSVDNGMFPIKRVVGEKVVVEADIFVDGHDTVAANLLYRECRLKKWQKKPMVFLNNDRWQGDFKIQNLSDYEYAIEGWVDHFLTWQKDFQKRKDAGLDLSVDILIGIEHIKRAVARASQEHARRLQEIQANIKKEKDLNEQISRITGDELQRLIGLYPDKTQASVYEKGLRVHVDRKKAVFSTWYEIFPRSCSGKKNTHGTFKDCEKLLPEIAAMGFDVLYLPPIHPIGETKRKGKNNSPELQKGDPGCPWAIGSKEGGHAAVDPLLGTLSDFKTFIKKAGEHGLEIALDLALQCSPDHPYVKEHPEWFKKRPDGSIQYAENPPKKYEDIYPIDFDTEQESALYQEIIKITLFWIDKGVRIFRVDNPHTKPFVFWDWLIAEIQKEYPDVIFLSEAFTRPKVMYRLAKGGFTQSYTYFTWRNTKWELTQYLTELAQTEVKEFFRPNFWPNTPDILSEYLQYGGKPAFMIRLALAATMSSNYGIYGPAYELCVNEALPGKEEYKDSEKFEIIQWDRHEAGSLADLISRINQIRKDNIALQTTWNIRFLDVTNESLLSFAKTSEDGSNIILVVVNLDPYHTQSGWVSVPIKDFGIDPKQSYLLHDLISDDKYIWQGDRNYVELNPGIMPVHILKLLRKHCRESDFDYFM
ncbi:MAG: alpha-1,4-glucan--maltose-1-phosphate maltosyltransferase [bacterium]